MSLCDLLCNLVLSPSPVSTISSDSFSDTTFCAAFLIEIVSPSHFYVGYFCGFLLGADRGKFMENSWNMFVSRKERLSIKPLRCVRVGKKSIRAPTFVEQGN